MAALERMAAAHGLRRLHLFASLNAVAFYRAAGFVALSDERYAHPSGIELACVCMGKNLCSV